MRTLELSRKEEEKATDLHRESIIVDGCQASVFLDEYFKTVRDAGIAATIPTVAWNHNLREAVKLVSDWYAKIHRNSDTALFATSIGDVLRAKDEGRVAYIFGFQNILPLEGNTELLEVYKRLGVRMIQLTYNERNLAGDGCDERTDRGLSRFGINVIERMNKLGILLDLSHVGDRTTAEAIEISDFPVVSHANTRALCKNARNKTDEHIKAIAEKGGIVGITAYPSFVKWTRTERGERPTVADVLDHLEYVAEFAGVRHVGLGLDFIENAPPEEFELLASRPEIWGLPNPKGIYEYPVGLEGISKIINITRGLVTRGYSDTEIEKILGENWLTLLRRVL